MANHGDGEIVYTASGASHIAPPSQYIITWFVLLGLMVATIAAAMVDLGAVVNNLLAMAIATTKATLVIMFFMQVKGSSRLVIIWAAIGFVMFPFLFITLTDYLSRGWIPTVGWQ